MTTNTRNYGDLPNLQQDIDILRDVQARQGSHLIIDCLAEQVAISAHKFNLSDEDKKRLVTSLVSHLSEQLIDTLKQGE